MELTRRTIGAVIVLKPTGPLLQPEVEAFTTRTRDLIAESRGRMAIDLADVHYVDSAALEALIDIAETLTATGNALRVCAANETVREVMQLTGVNAYVEHFEAASDAARSFL